MKIWINVMIGPANEHGKMQAVIKAYGAPPVVLGEGHTIRAGMVEAGDGSTLQWAETFAADRLDAVLEDIQFYGQREDFLPIEDLMLILNELNKQ